MFENKRHLFRLPYLAELASSECWLSGSCGTLFWELRNAILRAAECRIPVLRQVQPTCLPSWEKSWSFCCGGVAKSRRLETNFTSMAHFSTKSGPWHLWRPPPGVLLLWGLYSKRGFFSKRGLSSKRRSIQVPGRPNLWNPFLNHFLKTSLIEI